MARVRAGEAGGFAPTARPERRSGSTPTRRSASAEQAGGPPQQDRDHRRIDEERAELRHQVLERRVADAEQHGGNERSSERTEPAHGDNDEEIDEMLDRVRRMDGEDLRAEAAAQRRKSAAEREGEGEQAPGVDA